MKNSYKAIITKEFLKKEYWKYRRNMPQIAKIVGCTTVTIFNYMRKFNVLTRNCSEAQLGKKFNKEHKENIRLSKTGKNNPNYGKSHNLEWNRKIAISNSITHKGKKLSRKHKDNIGIATMNCWKNEKTRKKMLIGLKKARSSSTRITNMKRGKNHHNYGKCFAKSNGYRSGYYKNIWMRSSWEIKFAHFLDCSNVKWKYEFKTFDLGHTTYTPDFYLSEFDCYIEVKGYWRQDAKEKFEVFCEKYSNICINILDGQRLKEFGII